MPLGAMSTTGLTVLILVDGILKRAVYAEAALQTVLRVKNSTVGKKLEDTTLAKYTDCQLTTA